MMMYAFQPGLILGTQLLMFSHITANTNVHNSQAWYCNIGDFLSSE